MISSPSEQNLKMFRRAIISATAFLSPFLLLNLQYQSPALANKGNRFFGSLCNGTQETLYVAIGVRPTTCGPGGCTKQYIRVTTEGWWVIPPRQCKRGVYVDTAYKNKYARGERFVTAYTASYRWEGNQNLCVKNSVFTMVGERGYQDCHQSNGHQRSFRQILSHKHLMFRPRNGDPRIAPEYTVLFSN